MVKIIIGLSTLLLLNSASHCLANGAPFLESVRSTSSLIEENQELMLLDEEELLLYPERLLVAVTGSLMPIRIAPSVASVITKENIEDMGATTLDEVLETVPGLHISSSGISALSSVWSIRGIRTNLNPQVLLLINGVPLTDLKTGGRPYFFTMPVAIISRVEVVRGPGSAIHGADAFGGTVNVITKDGHEIGGTQAGVRYGSFETNDAWLQHGGMYGDWNMVFSVEGRKTQGDDKRVIEQDRLGSGPPSLAPGGLNTEHDVINLNLGINKWDQWVGHFFGSWQNVSGLGPGVLQVLADGDHVDSDCFLVDFGYYNNDLTYWDFDIKASYFYQKFDAYMQLMPESFLNMQAEPIHEGQVSSLENTGIYYGLEGHQLRLASGLKYFDMETDEYKNFGSSVSVQYGPIVQTKGTNDFYLESQNRWLWFVSAQDEWYFAKYWTLTAGVRYDEYSDFGGTINPRLALVWETSPVLTSKLMYGRAFRSPAFNEQHVQNNPVVTGNPDLNPETIDTYEVAFIWQPMTSLSIAPSAFYYKIDGLIVAVGALPSPFENSRDQKGHGFEIEASWHALDTLELAGNVAYQRSEDKESGALVPDTPEWQAYLTADLEFLPEWFLNGQYFWVAQRHRAGGDPRNDIDNYDWVNLTLRRKNIVANCDLALSVRNLLDEDARAPSPYDSSAMNGAYIPNDYPMESRSIWAEVRFHF